MEKFFFGVRPEYRYILDPNRPWDRRSVMVGPEGFIRSCFS